MTGHFSCIAEYCVSWFAAVLLKQANIFYPMEFDSFLYVIIKKSMF